MTMSKTILITGCSSGFGRATALHLAQQGWHVFATVRKEGDKTNLLTEAAERGCAERLSVVVCGITNVDQVTALGQRVAAATPRLDALLNSAGIAGSAPLELMPLDALRAQLEINVVGHVAVTQALLPMLKAAHGTIINVSSLSGRIANPVAGGYSASKFAMEAVSDALRVELAPFGVRVVVVEPGPSPTGIQQNGHRAAPADGAAAQAYAPLIAAFDQMVKQGVAQGYPPQVFAEAVRSILESPRPRTRYVVPRQFGRMILLRKLLPDTLWDRMLRKSLNW
jgi:NAD(P)-dependent dehydrogenase (short-subunit alcohol dehydrogenase family)